MSIVRNLLAACAGLALAACAISEPPPAVLADTAPPIPVAPQQREPVTILVSIDGFRPDYLDRGVTPNLDALARSGISARMRPSFPSKTAPNHWTLVTGLRPDRHGVVANAFEDAARPGQVFSMGAEDPFWWNGGEPIWVTAERAGIRTATMFWPGSSVAWGGEKVPWPENYRGGTRPSDWSYYNMAASDVQRVDGVIDWLRRPDAAMRPRLLTLYFDEVDSAGHAYGPDDARTTAAVARVDGAVGRLVAGLRELGQPSNLVIVADHGMAATGASRVVVLDRLLAPAAYRTIDTGPFAQVVPTVGREAAVARALIGHHDHFDCWRRQDIPARFHFGSNPRIAPIFCLAEVGWTLQKAPATVDAGAHGYDNAAPDMAALFIASGPAIRPLGRVAAFDNVDVAPLVRDLIGLPAGTNLDGDDAPFRAALGR